MAKMPVFPALDLALAHSPVPAAIITQELRLQWSNRAFDRQFSARTGEALDFLHQQTDINVNSMFFLFDKMSRREAWQGPFCSENGKRKRHFEVAISPLPEKDFLILVQELTEYQEKLEDALHSSRSDRLTGLPNRRHFNDNMTEAVKQARRGRANQALLLLDLDGFKPINDTFGHDAGDAVLVEVARRMRLAIRETDFCARLGGDEFACLVANLKNTDDAGLVADKLIQSISQPIAYEKYQLSVNVSIGIAMIDQLKKTDETIKSADRALYLAKQQGKGCWRLPPEPVKTLSKTLAPPIFADPPATE